jgi:solute:Na+ symporter, SSS family
VAENDYDGIILSLVKKYCPHRLLGLALTALAGLVHVGHGGQRDGVQHGLDLRPLPGLPRAQQERSNTISGWAGHHGRRHRLSIVCAYFASHWSNAMDIIQLVFGFVNAPLFATFLLGMFWARTTGTGAFLGLLGGTPLRAFPRASTSAVLGKGGPGILAAIWDVVQMNFPSDMAQNFWLASFAFTACFLLTLVISLATKRTKTDEELKGLVYSLTPKLADGDQAVSGGRRCWAAFCWSAASFLTSFLVERK